MALTSSSPLRGRRRDRILGPVMLRVSCAELFSNFGPSAFPKSRQVERHLLGALVGRKQVQHGALSSDEGHIGEAEELLHSGSEHGRALGRIVHAHTLTIGEPQPLGYILVECLTASPAEAVEECLAPIDAAQCGKASASGNELWQEVAERIIRAVRDLEFRVHAVQPQEPFPKWGELPFVLRQRACQALLGHAN